MVLPAGITTLAEEAILAVLVKTQLMMRLGMSMIKLQMPIKAGKLLPILAMLQRAQ